ncbi:pilus assembly PilX family protein [Vreelandella salicampi]|uniref:Pilus assembly PilX N-terminal domain-containing protein n=1 Tax=Vreelandella salicampi TaxID=1449798 RepID=A0A7Z0RUD9_9GAMM|nr:pilus assembly PilX N-terminal domain-containing protein [Halomonas salicampi]NYS60472.1 pilus assembly PilX N-terminal domain-containing protein [Halomonas salicampi]
MRQHQEGAALVIVLALLTGSLMIGVSGMNSALIDERLAGNYRASAQAQMTSERILSTLASDENQADREKRLKECLERECSESLRGNEIADLLYQGSLHEFVDELIPEDLKNDPDAQDQVNEIRTNLLESLVVDIDADKESQTVNITVSDKGLRNSARRSSSATYKYKVFNGGGEQGYERGIVGCEGITVDNSTEFNSFHSVNGIGFYQDLRNAPLITRRADADVFFKNNSRIYGNVASTNDIIFSSSTEVIGSAYVNDKIEFGNWSSEVKGNVVAESVQGKRHNTEDHVLGDLILRSGGSELNILADSESCDILGVKSLYDNYVAESVLSSSGDISLTGGASQPAILDASGFTGSYLGSNVEVETVDSVSFVRIDDFTLSGSRSFQVGTSSSPVNLVMLVEGDFEVSGNTKFVVEDGSQLTIMVRGNFNLIESNDIESNQDSLVVDAQADSVEPVIKLVSLYNDTSQGDDAGAGVRISGDSNYYGEIFAPFSNVNILGSSNLYGAIYSRSLYVGTRGNVYYDEAFGLPEFNVEEQGGLWCSFSNLSPLTVVHPLASFKPPSSNAAFDGKNLVPDVAVANGDGSEADNAERETDTTREGVLGGVFDNGNDAEKFDDFIQRIRQAADIVEDGRYDIKNQGSLGGKNNPFGTPDDKKITFINGNLSGNNLTGAGILVVNGNASIKGNPAYEGLMIVLGDYYQSGGGGDNFIGALLVAPYSNGDEFTSANIEFKGGGGNDFIHDAEVLKDAFDLLDDDSKNAWQNDCSDSKEDDDDGGDEDEGDSSGDEERVWELIDWR